MLGSEGKESIIDIMQHEKTWLFINKGTAEVVLGQSVVVVAVATRVLHNLTDMTRDIQGDWLFVVQQGISLDSQEKYF